MRSFGLFSPFLQIKYLFFQLYTAFVSNLGSVYLGYVLYFVLKNLCVVCVAIYAVNFLLLVASFVKLRKLRQLAERRTQYEGGSMRANLPTRANPTDFKKNI